MIGTTLVEFVFIRITITLLRLVAPLSLIYLAAGFWRGTLDLASPLTLYALLEFAFFALVYLPRKIHLQKVGVSHYRPHQLQPTFRNVAPTTACQTPCAHTKTTQGAREEMYQSSGLGRRSRALRLVQLRPCILGESRQFCGVAVLGDLLFDSRRRRRVSVGSRRVSGGNGAARWDETCARSQSGDKAHPCHSRSSPHDP